MWHPVVSRATFAVRQVGYGRIASGQPALRGTLSPRFQVQHSLRDDSQWAFSVVCEKLVYFTGAVSHATRPAPVPGSASGNTDVIRSECSACKIIFRQSLAREAKESRQVRFGLPASTRARFAPYVFPVVRTIARGPSATPGQAPSRHRLRRPNPSRRL